MFSAAAAAAAGDGFGACTAGRGGGFDTRFNVTLKLHHVSALHPESKGARLGCELEGLGGESARALQRYIDQTQKRRRLMALDGS